MKDSKDTVRSVKALIKKVDAKIATTIGLAKDYWVSFLAECNKFLDSRISNSFVAGKWYDMTFIGDSDLYVPLLIVKRTKCFITFLKHGELKRAKIQTYQGVEKFNIGNYSMAPSCYAK